MINYYTMLSDTYWSSKLDAVFQCADKVAVAQFDDVEVVWLLHVLDPLVGLALWINHQWPTTSIPVKNKMLGYRTLCTQHPHPALICVM